MDETLAIRRTLELAHAVLTEQWHVEFERWRAHYRARLKAKDDANDARALKLLAEQSPRGYPVPLPARSVARVR